MQTVVTVIPCHFWWASVLGVLGCCTPPGCTSPPPPPILASPPVLLASLVWVRVTSPRCLGRNGEASHTFPSNPRGHADSHPGQAEVLSEQGVYMPLCPTHRSPRVGAVHMCMQDNLLGYGKKCQNSHLYLFLGQSFKFPFLYYI